MGLIEATLALLLAVAAVAAISKWINAPLPVLLVAGGVALSFLPGLRSLRIEPDIFFLLFIPPLLFSDAWLIPKRDLLKVMRPVLLLAFGLVFLTVLVVGYLMHWLLPDLPLAAAFALGAVISPTDAVAVRAITSRLAIPSRVSTIIDGESLINDASGLIAFKFAIAAAMTGAFSWSGAVLEFFVSSGGGFLLGLAIAWVIGQARVGLRRFCVDDPTIQTVISLLTPYAAYLAAEALGIGSILAVVGAGLYAGAQDMRHLDAPTRAHSWEVWRMVLFAFNGVVFVLLGVQLRSIIGALSRASALELVGYALALSAAVMVLRILWVFPAAYVPLLLSKRIREREGVHSPRAVFLTGWAGIRGSITLAAALSIPFVTSTGRAIPGPRAYHPARGKRDHRHAAGQRHDASFADSLAGHPRRSYCRARGTRRSHRDRPGGHREPAQATAATKTSRGDRLREFASRAIRAAPAALFGQCGKKEPARRTACDAAPDLAGSNRRRAR